MTEEWRPIAGFEGSYEVSDQGRVRSLTRYIYCLGNQKKRRLRGRIMQPRLSGRGYWAMALRLGNVQYQSLLHRLVCAAFNGPAPTDALCRHLNDDRLDNRAVNLAWGTPADNAQDSIRNGRLVRGESHPSSKLTLEEVNTILRMRQAGALVALIAADLGRPEGTVRGVTLRKTWAHVPIPPAQRASS
jgi:hypothetical protein